MGDEVNGELMDKDSQACTHDPKVECYTEKGLSRTEYSFWKHEINSDTAANPSSLVLPQQFGKKKKEIRGNGSSKKKKEKHQKNCVFPRCDARTHGIHNAVMYLLLLNRMYYQAQSILHFC